MAGPADDPRPYPTDDEIEEEVRWRRAYRKAEYEAMRDLARIMAILLGAALIFLAIYLTQKYKGG